ncbi:hypothetical protein [Lysinibacillus sphaericus]|uniref:hypothetical protein n=1 Tax=Lysinibacillus sphaericus TaxID=1421 RepID=UPI0018CEF839|nr:hypothetical protein [Lysinibacillus sphaericus]
MKNTLNYLFRYTYFNGKRCLDISELFLLVLAFLIVVVIIISVGKKSFSFFFIGIALAINVVVAPLSFFIGLMATDDPSGGPLTFIKGFLFIQSKPLLILFGSVLVSFIIKRCVKQKISK